MDEQKNRTYPQMNTALNDATVHIEAEPDKRRAAFRVAHHLLNYSFPDEKKVTLAAALGYKNAETMRADTEALIAIIIQVQEAFGEDDTCGLGYEDDTDTPAKDCGIDQGGQ